MRKLGKKLLTVVMATAICLTCFAPMTAKADSERDPEFTKTSSVWTVAEGVTAYIRDGILYVDGNGEIPNYTSETLHQRPWHTSIFGTVVVGKGITNIGTMAFAENAKLQHFFVHSTTFISDSSVFHKIDNKPIVRIQGIEETTRLIGDKIPYTSMDSWARIAQSASHNILYIMDNGAAKNFFRQKTLPNIGNVYSADNPNIDHPTTLVDDEQEKLQEFKSPLHFASGYEIPGRAVTSKQILVGEAYLDVIAFYLNYIYADYNYGLSYSNMVSTGDKIYPQFEDTKRYCYHIPAKLQSPGREFKVIQIVDGQPVVLEDLDQSDSTITFATNMGTFNYSIIYK